MVLKVAAQMGMKRTFRANITVVRATQDYQAVFVGGIDKESGYGIKNIILADDHISASPWR